jgi:foldase protein PrsA
LAKRPPGRRTLARTPTARPEEKEPSGRKTAIVITATAVAVIAISIIVGLYFTTWQDLWSTVIRVNDETISMDYLIRRMKYFDRTEDVEGSLRVLTEEEFIRQGASRYGIEATSDDVDELLRDIARGENETISESEFKVWYRNTLNEIQLSDTEYREWILTRILADRLNQYLIAMIPTVIEQVHLYYIELPSVEDAEAVIARFEDGEDFSELARELSSHEKSAEQGGDIGWWPRGALDPNLGYVAFNLEIGQISGVIGIDEDTQTYAVCMVTEKQDAREIEEDKLVILENLIFREWLNYEWDTVDYDWLSLDGGDIDSYTIQWISLQLQKE